MRCFYCFVNHAIGMIPALIRKTWHGYAALTFPEMALTITVTINLYSGLSKDILEGLKPNGDAACNPANFSRVKTRWFRFRGTDAPSTRTPRRHAQGAIWLPAPQMPRVLSLACFSNSASRNAPGANRLYHHAHPAQIIFSDTSSPFRRRIFTTARPYLSIPIMNACGSAPTSRDDRYCRAALYPIWPRSGASIPHNRNTPATPGPALITMVSPSQQRFIDHTEEPLCLS